jgi:hypothetical protein
MSFLKYMQREDGRFHNQLSYRHDFLDDVGSDDCLSRILWACGYALDTHGFAELTLSLKELFDQALPWVMTSPSPRAKAMTLLGLCHYSKVFPEDENIHANLITVANWLQILYTKMATPKWPWFETYLTYINARLPHALFEAYSVTDDESYLQIAKASFSFLIQTQILNGIFIPIGNKGWYVRGGERALFDQQPIEATCMVETAHSAFKITQNETYKKVAQIAFSWFLGKNVQGVPVYNEAIGSCYDGLTVQGVNLNQGAESNLAYLLARLEIELLSQ